jgi:hypothetical protein
MTENFGSSGETEHQRLFERRMSIQMALIRSLFESDFEKNTDGDEDFENEILNTKWIGSGLAKTFEEAWNNEGVQNLLQTNASDENIIAVLEPLLREYDNTSKIASVDSVEA